MLDGIRGLENKLILANNIRIHFLQKGSGPLVVLLHGFPDNAYSWIPQMDILAANGYRAVAPFLRGYAPTECPTAGFFDLPTLATDIRSLINELGENSALLVGEDWGAAITYAMMTCFPDVVKRAVTMATPHPEAVKSTFSSPEDLRRSFHWWFFQLQGVAEEAVRANDFAFIDWFWKDWSPNLTDTKHIRSVKDSLAAPGALQCALNYYRASFREDLQDIELKDLAKKLTAPISIPTFSIFGDLDIRTELFSKQDKYFTGPYRSEILKNCGHFLNREEPEKTSQFILEWFKAPN